MALPRPKQALNPTPESELEIMMPLNTLKPYLGDIDALLSIDQQSQLVAPWPATGLAHTCQHRQRQFV